MEKDNIEILKKEIDERISTTTKLLCALLNNESISFNKKLMATNISASTGLNHILSFTFSVMASFSITIIHRNLRTLKRILNEEENDFSKESKINAINVFKESVSEFISALNKKIDEEIKEYEDLVKKEEL